MATPERRVLANAALREKINQIQSANQVLKNSIDAIEIDIIDWARHHGAHALPDSKVEAMHLQKLLNSQARALEQAKTQILGESVSTATVRKPVISSEEMAALMRIQS